MHIITFHQKLTLLKYILACQEETQPSVSQAIAQKPLRQAYKLNVATVVSLPVQRWLFINVSALIDIH